MNKKLDKAFFEKIMQFTHTLLNGGNATQKSPEKGSRLCSWYWLQKVYW